MSGPQSVFPLLLSRRRVLVFSRSPSDDARLLDPELVNLQDTVTITCWTVCPSEDVLTVFVLPLLIIEGHQISAQYVFEF